MKGFLSIEVDERFEQACGYIVERLSHCVVGNFVERVVQIQLRELEDVTLLIDVLTEVIINDCKSYFIEKSIKLVNIDELSKHIFIKTLCAFDYETDKIIVEELLCRSRAIVGQKSFLLGSFYDFCLDGLKKRWSEVCILTNENISCLSCRRNFDELLKFMISNVDSRCNEVFLVERMGRVQVLDRSLQRIEGVYVNGSLSNEIQVIETLIYLGPRKIIFLGSECEVFGRVRGLFRDNCVEVSLKSPLLAK